MNLEGDTLLLINCVLLLGLNVNESRGGGSSSFCAGTEPMQLISSLYTCRHEVSRYPQPMENLSYLKVDEAVAQELRNIDNNREAYPTKEKSVDRIESAGYPFEEHRVTTEDGYILTLYRIPHGKTEFGTSTSTSSIKKPPVLLQHGLFTYAAFWLTQTENKNLPYILAQDGYDVFLGNSRGTVPSQRHISLSPKGDKFWDFDWEDMGLYDLPAVIDYMLKINGNKKIYYIGHSMGTTEFFVGMSLRPEYNDKIRLMIAYSPIAYVYHTTSAARVAAPMGYQPFMPFTHGQVILPTEAVNYLSEVVGKLCDPHELTSLLCSNLLFIVVGFDYSQTNATQFYKFMEVAANPVSLKSVQHFAQGVLWNDFRRLNYGTVRNCKTYGTCNPPRYNLDAITAPVATMYGHNDVLANVTDVYRLMNKLPNLVLNYSVPFPYWNHIDFVTAIEVRKLIFLPTLEIMKRF